MINGELVKIFACKLSECIVCGKCLEGCKEVGVDSLLPSPCVKLKALDYVRALVVFNASRIADFDFINVGDQLIEYGLAVVFTHCEIEAVGVYTDRVPALGVFIVKLIEISACSDTVVNSLDLCIFLSKLFI